MSAGTPRVQTLLETFGHVSELSFYQLVERTGWDDKTMRSSIGNLKGAGLITRVSGDRGKDGKCALYCLTRAGIDRLEGRDAGSGQESATASDPDTEALTLIDAAAAGMDSEALADKLGLASRDVVALLAKHVASGRLVSCDVQRALDGELVHMVMYRSSMASPSSLGDWRLKGSPEPREGDREHPPRAARQLLASQEPKLALPVLEVDIDAVHRKQRESVADVIEGEAAGLEYLGQATVEVLRDDPAETSTAEVEFQCALYSGGQLVIESHGKHIELPLAHTRRLLHYLDRVCGEDIVASVLSTGVLT